MSGNKKFWKFLMILAFLGVGIGAVIIRLFIVQVVEREEYRSRAKNQHESRIELPGKRGLITDRNGVPLTSNIKGWSVAIDPNFFRSDKKKTRGKNDKLRWRIINIISSETGLEKSILNSKFKTPERSFVWLARGLNSQQIKKIKEIEAKGLIILHEPKRRYIYGSSGAQLIGCTNIDNKGINGIEKQYDDILKGESGLMTVRRNAHGYLKPAAGLPVILPKNGHSVMLTIDIRLQNIVEYELKNAVRKYEAKSGTVIALNPSTGELLSMASYPNYNPNSLINNSTGTMRNRGLTDTYEPGSTFKLVTACAALEEKIYDTSSVFDAMNGVYERPGFVIRDDHILNKVSFKDALVYSSNIVFAQIAEKVPDHEFYKYIRNFGFGLTYGIEIPGEVKGKVPKPEEYLPYSKPFMGHGYNLSVTALQLVSAYSAVANGGELMQPYVVKEITSPEGDAEKINKPVRLRRVVSRETAKIMTDLLTEVVRYGTGERAKIRGLRIAGKTGTSEQLVDGKYSDKFHTASFAGFFPADDPKIVMLVIIDRPQGGLSFGGSTAAPVFKNIALKWINTEPEYSISGEPNKEIRDGGLIPVPLVRGMNSEKAEVLLEDKGLNFENSLDGKIIYKQYPEAGKMVREGTKIRAEFITMEYDTAKKKYLTLIKKPDLTGLPLRRALSILHSSGIAVEIEGSGKVKRQLWKNDKSGRVICYLVGNQYK